MTGRVEAERASAAGADDRECDLAVVGGGIVGLAVALAAARRGRAVTLFERHARAEGASVRNFGMVWPVGLPAGPLREAALLSRRIWLELAGAAGFWVAPCGSVHLARAADELAVLEEYMAGGVGQRAGCRLLTAEQVVGACPGARPDGLRGGLWSPTELAVDPREVVGAVTGYLRERYGVRVVTGVAVAEVDAPSLRTGDGRRWRFDEAVVCGGIETATLFPDLFARSGVRRCKLQMMRTVPQPGGWRLGTHVAGGASLRHYPAFAGCPSVDRLRRRLAADHPELDRFGIHVMAAQNGLGEVTVGDSHEYDAAVTPFDNPEIDDAILRHAGAMLDLPDRRIARRWHGTYTRHADLAQFVGTPQPGVTVVMNTNGLGMTLSFGLAEQASEAGRFASVSSPTSVPASEAAPASASAAVG